MDSADKITAVLAVFQRFDTNGDERISRDELGLVLKSVDAVMWTDVRVDALLQAMDTNADGQIQVDEFLQYVFEGYEDPDHSDFDIALDRIHETIVLTKIPIEREASVVCAVIPKAFALSSC